eukprot:TRINITY_DN5584_c0_g1_i1.p2 TRINITY_DN5584_c0_g1~~TRINITY_DN5584_c0_g1_i1.p2  ORF type:complete len:130 (+),score=54.92 TRINITY_DN5584_c0_g1_i1:2-391(+)
MPVHQLYVCTELEGKKFNIELFFTARPTVGELVEYAEAMFASEVAHHPLLKGRALSPVVTHRLVVFDKAIRMWTDLVTKAQLEDFTQVYLFQDQRQKMDTCQDLPYPLPTTMHERQPPVPYVVTGKYNK